MVHVVVLAAAEAEMIDAVVISLAVAYAGLLVLAWPLSDS
jgi:hypothetical protein